MKAARFLNGLRGNRLARILFLVAAFLLLATVVSPGPRPAFNGPTIATFRADPVPLEEDRSGRRRVGRLLFLRGWVLTSDEPRFGAISAMHVEDGRVTAVSDAGTVLEFGLPTRPGIGRVHVHALPLAGAGVKRGRDTESLVVSGNQLWVGIESANAVKRYDRRRWRQESEARPRGMRRWRGNSGAEAMVRLSDGRFLVFAEGRNNDDPFSPVLLFAGDPSRPGMPYTELRYRRPSGFRVTDADLLPDGRLLILNRRFRWLEGRISAKLVVADLPPARPGAVISGREIATLTPPLSVENMEALSVAREGGRTIVRIASDDNFMPILRSLLLEFVLIEDARAN